jgi:hypothetical protein
MSSSKRFISTVGVLANSSTTTYVCASCRSALPSRGFQQVRHNSKLPFTERLRRKIWGTDNPPGLKDPYGGPSFLERYREERKQTRQRNSGEVASEPQQEIHSEQSDQQERAEPRSQLDLPSHEAPQHYEAVQSTPSVLDRADAQQHPDNVPRAEYKEATTWTDLEWVGYQKGEYRNQARSKADVYEP